MNKEKIITNLETKLNIKLIKAFNSIDNCEPDDEFGHFISYEVQSDKLHNIHNDYPLMLNIYEKDAFQFYHDATPIPTNLHHKQMAKFMVMTLCEHPMHIDKLDNKVFNSVLTYLKS